MKNKSLVKVIIATLVLLLLSSCADVANISDCIVESPYGFWSGLRHGVIAPFSFICSLFSEDIAMYGVNNNGGFYDFGFVLGAGILFGGSRF